MRRTVLFVVLALALLANVAFAHTAESETEFPLDDSFLSVAAHAGVDLTTEMHRINQLSQELAEQKHGVEEQRRTITEDENKLARLVSLLEENKQILRHNQEHLKQTSMDYLEAVKKYTREIQAKVQDSMESTKNAAEQEVSSLLEQQSEGEEQGEAQAEAPRAAGRIQSHKLGADRSALLQHSAAAGAASRAHARAAAHSAAIRAEFDHDLSNFLSKADSTYRDDFAQFEKRLNLERQRSEQRAADFARGLNIIPAAGVVPTNMAEQQIRQEMNGEPVTMFLEMDQEVEEEAAPDVPPKATTKLVKPVIDANVKPLSEPAPAPAEKKPALPDCPETKEALKAAAEAVKEQKKAVALLEAHAEMEESDEMMMMELEAEATALLETGAEAESEAEAEASTESESEGESESDAEADVDSDSELDVDPNVEAAVDADLDSSFAEIETA